MKPKKYPDSLESLLEAARRAPARAATSAPLGFSTRVAARAFERPSLSLSAALDRLSWRAFALSCLLMALTVASSYGLSHKAGQTASTGDDDGDLQDPVSELIELVS